MSYYNVLEKLKTELENDPLVNTVTQGNLFDIDLAKQTIFPLCHIVINGYTFQDNVVNYSISILAMDIVDITKEEQTDIFYGNTNEVDILNTRISVLNRLYEKLRRGDLFDTNYQVDGFPSGELFEDRFENKLTGSTITFNLLIPNDMTVCDV